jgi:hypothetical protein
LSRFCKIGDRFRTCHNSRPSRRTSCMSGVEAS